MAGKIHLRRSTQALNLGIDAKHIRKDINHLAYDKPAL